MFKKVVHPSAFLLALVLLVAPAGTLYADPSPSCGVTGCDPVPPPSASQASWLILLSILKLG